MLDQPGKEVEVKFVVIQHLAAGEAMQELRGITQAKRTAQGQGPAVQSDALQIIEQARTNRLLLVGTPDDVTMAESLLASIDVPLGLETRSYRVATASAKRIDELVRNLIGEVSARQSYHSVVDETSGLLIVTSTPKVHAQVKVLASDLVSELASVEPVTRFYKLANATASEVLATISEIEGVGGIRVDTYAGGDFDSGLLQTGDTQTEQPEAGFDPASETSRDTKVMPPIGVETGRARVMVDPNTNTLIVVAEPAVQLVYQDLIDRLDRRRPQVQIEITLVTIDTSGGFSLGVESARSDESGEANTLTFSSFGLSEVDTATGSLDIIPGLGFNGTVVSADIADVVVRALSANGRSKVVSAPRILVNDNATGSLTSASDAPTTSINASNTVSTTSFAGFESAGTNIEVTPHISEGDHLSLEYSISLSSFGEGGSDGIPPPRQRSELSSEVTVHISTAVLILLTVLAGWSYYTMVSQRSSTHRSAQELKDCTQLVSQIQVINSKPKRTQSGELAHTDLTQRIEEAAGSSGIDSANLTRIAAAPPRRLAKLPYEERPTSIAMGRVTLPQFVAFLHLLSSQAEGLWIKDITLRAPRSEEVGDRWVADATISYLIYIPESE